MKTNRDRSELFCDGLSPEGIEIVQITSDEVGGQLIYPEIPGFLSDGSSLLYSSPNGLEICHLDDNFRITSLHELKGAAAVSPDGRHIYTRENDTDRDVVTLWRLDWRTMKKEIAAQFSGRLPGSKESLANANSGLGSISSDESKYVHHAHLNNGEPNAPFGIVVWDLKTERTDVILEDPEFCNAHVQYTTSTDPERLYDLLIQMNHGCQTDRNGRVTLSLEPSPEGKGVDIHVVRDDGTNWRDMPWGRDGQESCIGHQLWRGDGESAVAVTLENNDPTYGELEGTVQKVVEGWPVAADRSKEHIGLLNPGSRRNVLSDSLHHGRFCHLAMDQSGMRFAFDTFSRFEDQAFGQRIYVGTTKDRYSAIDFTYICNQLGDVKKDVHAHPILSPDGRLLLFNARIDGRQQICLVDLDGIVDR